MRIEGEVRREQKRNRLHLVVEGNHAGSAKEGGACRQVLFLSLRCEECLESLLAGDTRLHPQGDLVILIYTTRMFVSPSPVTGTLVRPYLAALM